jgi:hypothetical protein
MLADVTAYEASGRKSCRGEIPAHVRARALDEVSGPPRAALDARLGSHEERRRGRIETEQRR